MISQSNYIPWKGFFDAINAVDAYVFYDDMQFTKRDWRNRNKIKTPAGTTWLSIPVLSSGRFTQTIKETKVTDFKWSQSHFNKIKENYKMAPYFREYEPWLKDLYKSIEKIESLSEINITILKNICSLFSVKTEFIDSGKFDLSSEKTQRLVDISKELGVKKYYTGPAAKNYLQEELFNEAGISVEYFDFTRYPAYTQVHGEFEHGVTVLDLIFSTGPKATEYMFMQSKAPITGGIP